MKISIQFIYYNNKKIKKKPMQNLISGSGIEKNPLNMKLFTYIESSALILIVLFLRGIYDLAGYTMIGP